MLDLDGKTAVIASRDIQKAEPVAFIPDKLLTTCE